MDKKLKDMSLDELRDFGFINSTAAEQIRNTVSSNLPIIITGANNVGKTTLLRAILKETPCEGTYILLDNEGYDFIDMEFNNSRYYSNRGNNYNLFNNVILSSEEGDVIGLGLITEEDLSSAIDVFKLGNKVVACMSHIEKFIKLAKDNKLSFSVINILKPKGLKVERDIEILHYNNA